MTTVNAHDLLADLDAEAAAEAARLADTHRRRREALAPAAELAQQILDRRTEFLAADTERLDQLTALLKQAKRNGASPARLAALTVPALTTAPAGRVRARKKTTTTPAPAAPVAADPVTPPQADPAADGGRSEPQVSLAS